jgi:hypothetical protein
LALLKWLTTLKFASAQLISGVLMCLKYTPYLRFPSIAPLQQNIPKSGNLFDIDGGKVAKSSQPDNSLAVAHAISRASKDLVLEQWEISQGRVLQRKKSDF